jgi:hypothetical protein
MKGHPSLKHNNIPQEHARRRAGSGHNVDGGHGRHDGYLEWKLKAVKVKATPLPQQQQTTFLFISPLCGSDHASEALVPASGRDAIGAQLIIVRS